MVASFELLMRLNVITICISVVSISLSVFFSYYIFWATREAKTSRAVVWVDKKDELFSATRSKLRSFRNGRTLFCNAYYNYSKNNQLSIISTISIPLVMIPSNKRKWFFEQKKDILDHRATGFDAVETQYTMPCGHILESPTHIAIIKKDLTRELGNLTSQLVDEVEQGLKELWGTDTENWQEVVLWDTIMALVTRTFNRILVGKPLCDNKKYLINTKNWSKPLIGRLLSLPCWYYFWHGKRYALPLIQARLAEGLTEVQTGEEGQERNDFVMWIIRTALKMESLVDLQLSTIYARLMSMNFAGIHTSSFTTVNCLIDALSHENIFQNIEKEVTQAYVRCNGKWTKAAIDGLEFVDGALRESIRCSGPIVRLLREVVAEKGVDIDGVTIPKGTKLAVDMHNMHLDDTVYQDAKVYNPNRFTPFTTERNSPVVKTNEYFLGFGHGRNACPGRFFAAHEIKIIVSTIALRYNLDSLESRPENIWMGDSSIPHPGVKLRVKRKALDPSLPVPVI